MKKKKEKLPKKKKNLGKRQSHRETEWNLGFRLLIEYTFHVLGH